MVLDDVLQKIISIIRVASVLFVSISISKLLIPCIGIPLLSKLGTKLAILIPPPLKIVKLNVPTLILVGFGNIFILHNPVTLFCLLSPEGKSEIKIFEY